MAETRFTYGPWKWEGSELMAEGGFAVLTAGSNHGCPFVRVEDYDSHLIAAAPELYSSLDYATPIVQMMERMFSGDVGEAEFIYFLVEHHDREKSAECGAALQRARGEA